MSLREAMEKLAEAAADYPEHGSELGHIASGFEQGCPRCWSDAIRRALAAHPEESSPERPLFDREQGEAITSLLAAHPEPATGVAEGPLPISAIKAEALEEEARRMEDFGHPYEWVERLRNRAAFLRAKAEDES